MPARRGISAEVKLVSEVLQSSRYEVPWHQRYYDWNSTHVNDLLYDLNEATELGRSSYFLGSIMLVPQSDNRPQCINDGQQRLITLSLVLACMVFQFSQMRDEKRKVEALRLLFDLDHSVTPKLEDIFNYTPRINPPWSDEHNFLQMIHGQEIGSNGKLTEAYRHISKFIRKISNSPSNLSRFHDFVVQRIKVTVLVVPENEDANLIFETLNARGKSLDAVDLIRNRFYSYFTDESQKERRNQVHRSIEDTVNYFKSSKKTESYFRCFLQCEYGALAQSRLYTEFRHALQEAVSQVDAVKYVHNMVQRLAKPSSRALFGSLASSSNLLEIFSGYSRPRGVRPLSRCLQELRGYSVTYPILFAWLRRVSETSSVKCRQEALDIAVRSISDLASFVMRTSFLSTKFEPSHFDKPFANYAHLVASRAPLSSLNVMSVLKKIEKKASNKVLDNRSFRRAMATIEFTNPAKARMYLFGINESIQRGSDILRADRCALEHILPRGQQHWKKWPSFTDEKAKDLLHRSGNLTLLSRGESTGSHRINESFNLKKEQYSKSALQITVRIAENYHQWNPEAIVDRSEELAKQAVKAWRFNRI